MRGSVCAAPAGEPDALDDGLRQQAPGEAASSGFEAGEGAQHEAHAAAGIGLHASQGAPLARPVGLVGLVAVQQIELPQPLFDGRLDAGVGNERLEPTSLAGWDRVLRPLDAGQAPFLRRGMAH